MQKTALPKYLLLSQEIEEQISSRAWPEGRMPSLRGLAEQHRVSVITASRAIQVLRDKGLIARTDHSGCYLANPNQNSAATTWGLCLRITPGHWQKLAAVKPLAGFETLTRRGLANFYDGIDLGEGVTPIQLSAQVGKAVDAGVAGFFLLPSRQNEEWMQQDEHFLAACDAEGLPVVLVERNLRGHYRALERDLSSVDDFDGGVCCTRHLLKTGRRRLAAVVASPCSSHDERAAGYLHAVCIASMSGEFSGLDPTPRVFEVPPGLANKQVDRLLADRVITEKIDGVFCYQDSTAVGLIVELLSRGVAVPRDVAVAGFENLPIGDFFTLGLTTYNYPAEALAMNALRLMRARIETPDGPPLKLSARGELIVRESTGEERA
ncbi:GntR family transcriptional regulator [Fimbriiglobus ruber]|uniref:LacI-family transcriptional regulator n=1 Tax=Fimbriiglobus ruber TaxID=1908690 RepID=A0A225DPC1_9BACT|nr:substrate-binding domain-containing protein [Fimbriiglobus ruber]OWK43242.1 lacI-family transcriptional regulator [Fimbriiglobus ruber]